MENSLIYKIFLLVSISKGAGRLWETKINEQTIEIKLIYHLWKQKLSIHFSSVYVIEAIFLSDSVLISAMDYMKPKSTTQAITLKTFIEIKNEEEMNDEEKRKIFTFIPSLSDISE